MTKDNKMTLWQKVLGQISSKMPIFVIKIKEI